MQNPDKTDFHEKSTFSEKLLFSQIDKNSFFKKKTKFLTRK